MLISKVELNLVGEWIAEIEENGIEEEIGDDMAHAWDDVHGGVLPLEKVEDVRKEEDGYMEGRGIWKLRPQVECWEKTGKAPVSVRWVDTNKGGPSAINCEKPDGSQGP